MERFRDREVSAVGVAAGFHWVAAVVLVVYDAIAGSSLGHLGLFFAIVASCMTIRCYLAGLMEMQCNAFEIGRDYERAHAAERRPHALP